MASLKGKATNGLIWTAIERLGTQIISLVIGIVIARILNPSDYGIIGMTAIFMAIANTLLDSGFGSALIQNKERNEIDYTTCFYFNIAIGLLLYGILFFCSDYIAVFYNTQLLSSVIKVLALTLLLNSLTITQTAKLTVELKFKELSIITIVSQLFTALLGLFLAYFGYGVWSLIIQQVTAALLRLILIELFTHWKPLFLFSTDSFKRMFSYGSKILISSIINTIYNNIYTLVIGKAFTPVEVGHFNRANQFAALPADSIQSIVMKVAFPLMSEVQDDTMKLRTAYLKFLRLPIFIIAPVQVGLIILAHPFIDILLGEKWLACVPLLQILSLGFIFVPLTHINLNILYVKGRTDLVLKLELIKKPIAFIILFSMIPLGLFWLCAGKVLYSFIAFTFNCFYTGKYIKYGFFRQLFYLVPLFLKVAAMGVIMWYITNIFTSSAYKLIIGTFAGIISFLVIGLVTKDESLYDIKELIKIKLTNN